MKYLILYDNHQDKRRKVPYFDGVKKSFVRIYEINQTENSVMLCKSFPVKQSIIRSNAIYEENKHRVFAMSGFYGRPQGKRAGAIEEFDLDSMERINRYDVSVSFYRAYGLKFQYVMWKEMLQDDYRLGTLLHLSPCKKIGVTKAVKVPECKKDYDLYKIYCLLSQHQEEAKSLIQTSQDVAYMRMRLCEQVLYLHGIDHVMKKIYFVGKKHYYLKNFDDTEQKNYISFGRLPYAVAVSIDNLEQDIYNLYILAQDGKLYDMRKRIVIT